MSVLNRVGPAWLSEGNWLSQHPWLTDSFGVASFGMQAKYVITKAVGVGVQGRLTIAAAKGTGLQTNYILTGYSGRGVQSKGVILTMRGTRLQARGVINKSVGTGLQSQGVNTQRNGVGLQSQGVNTKVVGVGLQARLNITRTLGVGLQSQGINTKSLGVGLQSQGVITKESGTGVQGRYNITRDVRHGLQAEIFNTKTRGAGIQANLVRVFNIGIQGRYVLYNTTRVRILRDFPSRGTTGNNWTATSQAVGDFSPLNLNTDIVEQVWRTALGTSTAILTCDTQVNQGVFVDTIGILGHNFTLGATIIIEASNDSGFSPVGQSISIKNEIGNTYYIEPELPQVSYRYWRFIMQDTGNPDYFLRIGSIVFGSSVIFSTTECFVDTVKFKLTQYADGVQTEGFTNVRNDRGRKKTVTLDFRNLSFSGPNFSRLRDLFESGGTILKCLWIPTPQYPSRFAVFGKLRELPEEEHNDRGENADYVSLQVSVDESL